MFVEHLARLFNSPAETNFDFRTGSFELHLAEDFEPFRRALYVLLVHPLQKELIGDFAYYATRDTVIYSYINFRSLTLWLQSKPYCAREATRHLADCFAGLLYLGC